MGAGNMNGKRPKHEQQQHSLPADLLEGCRSLDDSNIQCSNESLILDVGPEEEDPILGFDNSNLNPSYSSLNSDTSKSTTGILNQVKLYQEYDVYDTVMHIWHEAVVTKIDKENRRVFVSYQEWGDQWSYNDATTAALIAKRDSTCVLDREM